MKDWNILLASQSPRRRQLLEMIDLNPTIISVDVEEIYPESLEHEKVPEYLSLLKGSSIEDIKENECLITADTIVIAHNEILGKPKNYDDAYAMLTKLSAYQHQVITGVTLKTAQVMKTFSETTWVTFQELTDSEIRYYLEKYSPYDKAGSYGIQEWIGGIAIKKIDGCFYNVMGLPTSRLYHELKSL